MPEFADHITEVVSEGSIHFEHSDCLQDLCLHMFMASVLSRSVIIDDGESDERVGLLGFQACSSTQWSRIALPALFEHQEQFLQLVKKMLIIIIIINMQVFQYHCCNISSDQAYRHITSYAEN